MNLFKNKKKRIIFEFEDYDNGFNITAKVEGDVSDAHIYGIKQFIDEKINKAKPNGKNRRK